MTGVGGAADLALGCDDRAIGPTDYLQLELALPTQSAQPTPWASGRKQTANVGR